MSNKLRAIEILLVDLIGLIFGLNAIKICCKIYSSVSQNHLYIIFISIVICVILVEGIILGNKNRSYVKKKALLNKVGFYGVLRKKKHH